MKTISAKDTITIRDDFKIITITRRVGDKYARKLIQDCLKKETMFKGGWFLSCDNLYEDDNKIYIFNVFNPYLELAKDMLNYNHN